MASHQNRQSLILLTIGFANLFIGVLTAVVLARLMPKAEYGEYVFALGLSAIASLPIELGLPTLMMREIARYRADEANRQIVAIIAWVFALLCGAFLLVASAVAIAFASGILDEDIPVGLALWSIALLLPLALMNWARGVLQGYEHPVEFALPDAIFRPILLLGFVGVAAWFGRIDATITMAAHVLAVCICFVWAFARSLRVVRKAALDWRFSRADLDWRAWLSSLLPITLISGIKIINRRLDIVMVGALATTAAVASYNIALQITSVVLVAQTVLNQRLGPKVAFAHRRGNLDAMRTHIAHSTLISSALAVASVAGIVVLGPTLIPFVFGNQYGEVYRISAILCAGQLFSGLMGPTTLLLNMGKFEKKTLQTGFAAAILNVALAAILIPHFLLTGAAIASSLTLFAIQSQRWWMVYRYMGVRSDVIAALRHHLSSHDRSQPD